MGDFRSGFVAVIGCPNAGKSTLLNALVGQKVAIVSKKPQTTRTRIVGVVHRSDCQIVFLDTPGLHAEKNLLDNFMTRTVDRAIADVDAVLYLVDGKAGLRAMDEQYLEKIKKMRVPLVVSINKTDRISDLELTRIFDKLQHYEKVIPISAKFGEGMDELVLLLKMYMPPGPEFYPANYVTDQPERVIAAEMIREKALRHLGKEIPHGVGVFVESVSRDEKDLLHLNAVIYCERDSHKGIIIGKGGARLKLIASEAREDIQRLFDEQIFLSVWVKVEKDWRNKNSILKILGYSDE